MTGFTCEAIKSVVQQLMSADALKGKIYVAGGIVPYLYTGRDSGRMHSDIDIVAASADMPTIRQYLQSAGFYESDYDSLEFGYNTGRVDYGIEAFIQGIPVSFAPFDVQGNDIIQRNFSKLELAGFDSLMTVTMRGIAVEDYITSHDIEGLRLVTACLSKQRFPMRRRDHLQVVPLIAAFEQAGAPLRLGDECVLAVGQPPIFDDLAPLHISHVEVELVGGDGEERLCVLGDAGQEIVLDVLAGEDDIGVKLPHPLHEIADVLHRPKVGKL